MTGKNPEGVKTRDVASAIWPTYAWQGDNGLPGSNSQELWVGVGAQGV